MDRSSNSIALTDGVANTAALGKITTKHPRRNSLDLLRGIAAFGVMVPHFFMYSSGGGAGLTAEIISACAVEVFFVLSGFVLGPQILLCMQRGNLQTYKIFLIRRWMRTIPPYLIALACVALIFRQLGSADFFKYAFYIGNLFDMTLTKDFYPVAWSLAVEEWYYVIFPLSLIITAPFLKRTRHQAVIAGIFFVVAIAVIRLVFSSDDGWGEHTRRIVFFRIDSIAYGFLLYLQVSSTHSLRRHLPIIAAMFAISTYAVYAVNVAAAGDANHIWRDVHPFVSAAFGCTTILFMLSLEDALSALSPLSAYLGRISYPVYLLHLPIIYVLAAALKYQTPSIQFAAYLTCTIALASVFNLLIERPILDARPDYRT
jgi:peptidoglycan/LPS O-acetylase OafA/YrhL